MLSQLHFPVLVFPPHAKSFPNPLFIMLALVAVSQK